MGIGGLIISLIVLIFVGFILLPAMEVDYKCNELLLEFEKQKYEGISDDVLLIKERMIGDIIRNSKKGAVFSRKTRHYDNPFLIDYNCETIKILDIKSNDKNEKYVKYAYLVEDEVLETNIDKMYDFATSVFIFQNRN